MSEQENRKIKKINYDEFFMVLEEHFCKKCEYYNKEGGHLWEDASCCTIDSSDGCIIFYLTEQDMGWEFPQDSEEKKSEEKSEGEDCQTKFCKWRKREHLKLIFQNTYGRTPTDEELETFEQYLRSIGKWK